MLSPNIFSLTDHEIYLVTTADEQKQAGMIATWIVPCTLVPEHPRIMAAISPHNYTYELIAKSQKFVIHMLAEGQEHLVPIFGLESSQNVNKLTGVEYLVDNNNIPIISKTCGWVKCQLIHRVDCGDRIICVGDIIEQKLEENKKPLHKNEAFSRQTPENFKKLLEKRKNDGIRDIKIMKQPISLG